MAFSKMYKKGLEWKKVRMNDEQVETARKEKIDADLDLFALVLARTKEKFPKLHGDKTHFLSAERIALAVFEKTADAFYTDIQNLLDDLIDVERDSME